MSYKEMIACYFMHHQFSLIRRQKIVNDFMKLYFIDQRQRVLIHRIGKEQLDLIKILKH